MRLAYRFRGLVHCHGREKVYMLANMVLQEVAKSSTPKSTGSKQEERVTLGLAWAFETHKDCLR